MQVLVLASRKGGSGKTTLAGHLAVEAERRGAGPVAMIDIDPQGSLADWWNVREAAAPLFVRTAYPSLARDLERLRAQGIKLLIVDTPPSLGDEVRAVVRQADLVAIPTRPSPHDLRSIGATVDMVEQLGKGLVFIINSATRNARITTETVTLLSQHGPLVPAVIHHRVDFASSMIDGRTVMELPGAAPAANEVGQLWDYLSQRLNTQERRPVLPRLPALRPMREALSATG